MSEIPELRRVDWTVVRTAASAALLLIVPGAFLSSAVLADQSNGWTWLFLCLILSGFGMAGYVAGRLRPDTPMIHGALSGLLAFAVAQLIGLVMTQARDESTVWIAIPLTALLAVAFGVAGSLLSDLVHRFTVRSSQPG